MHFKNIVTSSLVFMFPACNCFCQQEVEFLNQKEIKNKNIAIVIVNCYSGEKGKKLYADTISFSKSGNLIEKKIKVYDTSLISSLAGTWRYTYDSLGNLLGETRKSERQNIMDYNNLVYDSSRIKKRIWVYWINMRHQFDRIYEYNYEKTLNHLLKSIVVEDGTEKIDSVYFYEYDGKNRITYKWGSSDKKGKDTTFTISYSYNENGQLKAILETRLRERKVFDYFYDKSNKLIEEKSGSLVAKFEYDKEGLIISAKQSKNQAKTPFMVMLFKYSFYPAH